MKLGAWLEKSVSKKQSTLKSKSVRGQDHFLRQVSSVLSHNENEFDRGASRDQRLVSPQMVELLP